MFQYRQYTMARFRDYHVFMRRRWIPLPVEETPPPIPSIPPTPLTPEELAADAAAREARKNRIRRLKGRERRRPEDRVTALTPVLSLLSLTESSELDDRTIRKAFLRRSRETHPDTSSQGGSDELFKRVVWAYALLATEESRNRLRSRRRPPEFPMGLDD